VSGWRRTAIASLLLAVLASFATATSASGATKFGSRLLHVGARGLDVTALQRDLTAVGFTTVATGIFTNQTKAQVQAFQRRYRLSVDGVVGPTTYTKLTKVLRKLSNLPDSGFVQPGANQTATTATTPAPLPPTDSGGAGFVPPPADAPVEAAAYDSLTGLAQAPAGAPMTISEVIQAANQIAFKPYIYGGGHGSFNSAGYDCSGSVSYALHGANLLATPLDSTQFESYGAPGRGRWITLYANAGHIFMQVAGLWFDTAAQSAQNGNDRWSVSRVSPGSDWVVRHPTGW
jgi:peptidoglycan hydrolase-like protein with peptidoglycan-binding domain